MKSSATKLLQIVFTTNQEKFRFSFCRTRQPAARGGGSEPLLELVEPDEDCTLFSKSVKKLGAHPYHICYECENFNDALKTLQTEGFLMIQPPKVAPAIDGRNVAFLYSDAIGLIELVEKEVTS